MNRPPPVSFPLGGGSSLGWAVTGVWVLALVPVLAALALHPPARAHGAAWALALTAFMPGAWLTWRFWRDQKPGGMPGALVWNGDGWLLEENRPNGALALIAPPSIRFDGQRWLLLHVKTGRRAAWLWVARSADPARWHALRCALYAHVWTPVVA